MCRRVHLKGFSFRPKECRVEFGEGTEGQCVHLQPEGTGPRAQVEVSSVAWTQNEGATETDPTEKDTWPPGEELEWILRRGTGVFPKDRERGPDLMDDWKTKNTFGGSL